MFLTRTRQVVGVDIGSHAIKMVAVRPAKGELPVELTHFGLAELPEEAIVDGAIAAPAVVVETLAELFEQHKVKSRFAATSISGNAVIVRRVTMPRTDPEQLRESLPWEAEEYIPFDVDDVDLDFAILGEDEEGNTMEVVLVAAKRERVDEYVQVIQEAKRTPTIMDIDAFALQNAFEFSYPERMFEDVAILNLGASVINMAVLEAGRPAFWRDIAAGMSQYVAELQRQFMLDRFDAEELLRRVGRREGEAGAAASLADWSAAGEEGAELRDAATDPRVLEVVGQVSERVISEIKKTFDFYQAQALREHFDAVFLAGGGAHVADLARRLEERLGWPVERLDPMRRVRIPEDRFDPEYVWETAPQAAVALGLAIRGVVE